MQNYTLRHVHDDVLLRDTPTLAARGRATDALLLAHIAEVRERKLFRKAGQPNMRAYCENVLKFSEDAAKRRLQAASAARDYPVIFGALADGRLNLTSVCLLAPHLQPENADELLTAAMGQSKFEVEKLIASKFPKPDLPESLRVVPAEALSGALAASESESKSAPAHFFGTAQATHSSTADGSGAVVTGSQVVGPAAPTHTPPSNTPSPVVAPQWPRVKPLAPQRYALQATLDEQTHDLLREAQDLLAHTEGGRQISNVLKRALELLVRHLKQRKFAETEKPRVSSMKPKSVRTIPAAVKRAVTARDKGRCTFTNEKGERCPARSGLEFDHEKPVAKGGETIVENVRLRCRAHNQLAAEQAFGEGFMQEKRTKAQCASTTRKIGLAKHEPPRAEPAAQEAIHEKAFQVVPWLRQHSTSAQGPS